MERLTSKGMRRMDARSAVVSLDVHDEAVGDAVLRMVSGTPSRPSGLTTCSMRYETFPR